MTTHAPVDLDLLADYVAGALAGTPDGERVARLVATDQSWAGAHAAVLAAGERVRADLAGLGAVPVPLPAGLAERLDAAFTGPAPVIPLDRHPARAGQVAPPDRAGPGPTSETAPERHGRTAPVIPLVRRRRRRVWATTAAAAAVAGVVAGGVAVVDNWTGSARSTSVMSSSSGRSGRLAPAVPHDAAGAAPRLIASGGDYDARTLASAAGAAAADGASGRMSGNAPAPGALAAPVPGELDRLRQPAALSACLTTLTTRYGGTATLVDYARFTHQPALIVVLMDGGTSPARRVVAVGPDCGAAPGETDELAQAPA